MKKILTTGALLSIITPVAMTVSCGSKDTKSDYKVGNHFITLHKDGMFANHSVTYAERNRSNSYNVTNPSTEVVSLHQGFATFDFNTEFNNYNSHDVSTYDLKINTSSIDRINCNKIFYSFEVVWLGKVQEGQVEHPHVTVGHWMKKYTIHLAHSSDTYSMFKKSGFSKLFSKIKTELGQAPERLELDFNSLSNGIIQKPLDRQPLAKEARTWLFVNSYNNNLGYFTGNNYDSLPKADRQSSTNYLIDDLSVDSLY